MISKNKKFILLLLACFPTIAYANGGGPLLLFISGSAFIFGQVWILFIETLLLKKVSGLSIKTTFKHVFLANLVSTLIVGLGFPFFAGGRYRVCNGVATTIWGLCISNRHVDI